MVSVNQLYILASPVSKVTFHEFFTSYSILTEFRAGFVQIASCTIVLEWQRLKFSKQIIWNFLVKGDSNETVEIYV